MRISLQGVSKKYGKVHALKSVDLTFEPGQVIALVGINGAGKTTLLRALAGLIVPGAGEIRFDDEKFFRGNLALRKKLAFLPDFPVTFANLTVLKHIAMVLRLYGADGPEIQPRVMELLRQLDLMPLIDTRVIQLSRGQMYKTALAAFMAADPELWLLDEPFASGMDPNGISFFKHEARAAAARGRTVIYSTQILDIAEVLSDRLCVIDHGEVRHYGPLGELQGVAAGQSGASVLEQLFQQLREAKS